MTEHDTTTETDRDTDTEPETLSEIDHTHPTDNRSFGAAFRRGPTVIADGGRRETAREPAATDEESEMEPADPTEETADEPAKLGDISHTPPDGDGANRVWDGTQVRERTDEVPDDE
ncbi:MAG: hypothetical protein SVG88_09315 [Halobacteriales archaeon]|nr:hypothetical protein [Halobacteriales archaeon]